MSSPFADQGDLERFEVRLRSGADAFRRAPPPGLASAVMARLHETPPAARRAITPRLWFALAAASLALFLGLWWTRRPSVEPRANATEVVSLSRGILEAGSRVLDLPARAEQNLRLEARNLWQDAARTAEGLVRELPTPLRQPLQRL